MSYKTLKTIRESEQALKDVEATLKKDRRYLQLDCIKAERHDMLMAWLEELERRGVPPPPTATEPSRRDKHWKRLPQSTPRFPIFFVYRKKTQPRISIQLVLRSKSSPIFLRHDFFSFLLTSERSFFPSCIMDECHLPLFSPYIFTHNQRLLSEELERKKRTRFSDSSNIFFCGLQM